MTTSIKKPLAPSIRPKRSAARSDVMRSYRAASVLAMSHRGVVSNDAQESVAPALVRREHGLRIQQQWAISFIAVIAMLALLAGLYLNITASASIAGRQIQTLEFEITANEQINADLETRIAMLMANSVLERRADALGFEAVDPATLQYMVIPGYFPPQAVNMVAAAPVNQTVSESPEFNETLIDWVTQQIETASIPLTESRP